MLSTPPLLAFLIVHTISHGGMIQSAQTHADCFTRKPNGVIVLHSCKQNEMLRKRGAPKRPPAAQPSPQRKKILVVPTGREWGI